MNKIQKIAAAGAAFAALLASAVPAAANCSSGAIADFLCQTGVIDKRTANTMDGINAATGNPVDHAIARAAEAYVPGSGSAMEAYWAAQRSGSLPNFNGPPGPVMAPMPGPQFQPMRLGQVCQAPGGRAILPPAPIGTPCWVGTPYGPSNGSIVF